jgi:TRAP-type mannitol/chloroaromatic compound transport system permease large subunit
LASPPAAEEPTATEESEDSEEAQELGTPEGEDQPAAQEGPQQLGVDEPMAPGEASKVPENFHEWFWTFAALVGIVLFLYYRRMDGGQLEILKMLESSVAPLGVLVVVVIFSILFGITTATESAGMGALGALYLASYPKYPRVTLWSSLVGGAVGLGLGAMRGDGLTIVISAVLGALFIGCAGACLWDLVRSRRILRTITQSVYLTSRTTSMVCWLFVGSALFSAVFALHGGQALVEQWVLSLNLSTIEFMLLAQVIIFLLGWPLEWTEIIVIFVPIFLPLLDNFGVDPVLFAIMVAVNLQAAFLSPPVAMSAFYLKGVAPAHVTLNQIFAGMMPYMLIVLVCLAFIYVWPGMALFLPEFLYGN